MKISLKKMATKTTKKIAWKIKTNFIRRKFNRKMHQNY